MSNQSENEMQRTEIEAGKQAMAELSEEDLEAVAGGGLGLGLWGMFQGALHGVENVAGTLAHDAQGVAGTLAHDAQGVARTFARDARTIAGNVTGAIGNEVGSVADNIRKYMNHR